MRRTLLTAALTLPLLAAPALADERGLCLTGITAEEAIRIARAAGIERVQDVDCDDGKWEVEGRDAQGHRIEVKVHAGDGRVMGIERRG